MFDNELRTVKDWLFGRVARALFKKVPPSVLSVIGMATGLGTAYCIGIGWNGYALALWIISRIFDGIDGVAARIQHKSSRLGGYLDLMCDSVVYTAVPLAVAFHANSIQMYRAIAALLAAYYINVLSWTLLTSLWGNRVSNKTDTIVTIPRGIIEGFETVVFYGLLCLLPAYRLWLTYTVAALVGTSIVHRLIWAIVLHNRTHDIDDA